MSPFTSSRAVRASKPRTRMSRNLSLEFPGLCWASVHWEYITIASGSSPNKGLGTREISYGTCESAGEKAIGLDPNKSKISGGGGKQTTLPVDPPPSPRRGHRRNPLIWRLHLIWTNFLTRGFIKYRNSLPREITKHTPQNTTLANN